MKKEKLSEEELDLLSGGTLYVQSSTNGKKYKVTGFGLNTETGNYCLKYDNGKTVGYAATDVKKNSSLGAIIEKIKWDLADGNLFDHTVTVDQDLLD